MKKIVLLLLAFSLLLVLTACNNTIYNNNCRICGRNHPRDADGEATPKNFFEIFTPDSSEFLRIFVESCWSSSIPPDLRLGFTASYDIIGLYEAISNADSNVPFEVSFADETITLTTDILGLEEVIITYHQIQREVGFNYTMRRGGE